MILAVLLAKLRSVVMIMIKAIYAIYLANARIHDACMDSGDYSGLVVPDEKFGLGFKRVTSQDGTLVGFGHSGIGGSTSFCDIQNIFLIAITLINMMSMGGVTAKYYQAGLLRVKYPLASAMGPDSEMGTPLIN